MRTRGVGPGQRLGAQLRQLRFRSAAATASASGARSHSTKSKDFRSKRMPMLPAYEIDQIGLRPLNTYSASAARIRVNTRPAKRIRGRASAACSPGRVRAALTSRLWPTE